MNTSLASDTQRRLGDTGKAKQQLINNDWKFKYGTETQSIHTDYDDSTWFDVGIPHSFGIPAFLETSFYVGTGTYRREVIVQPGDVGKHIALEFHGVFQDAEIFVNGLSAGRHLGGYSAFTIDISDFVRAGSNLVAVQVSNEWNARLAPRAGEHVFNGGIYRDVSVIITNRTRIDWYGTAVSTVTVDGSTAIIDIATEIVNDGQTTFEGHLVGRISGPGPTDTETLLTSQVTIPAGSSIVHHERVSVAHPALWSPGRPNLYLLAQDLVLDGVRVDEAVTEFGIRTIEFTADRGFILNGEHLWIHGANVHQDHAGWGDAVTRAGIARDVALIRESGMNLIRGSHYPHHDYFATECDRQGMLFWSELAFWGIGGANAEGFWNASAYPPNPRDQADFDESCLRAIREMIRVNRNHPSIVAWSTGNEVFFSDDEVVPAAKELTSRLVALAHELDPTRPAVVGGAQRRGFDVLGDVAGYNGDGAALYQDPGFPSIVSEYGSLIGDRPGPFAPHFTDGVETPAPWRSGIVLWCGFHHGSIVQDMGRMGFIDHSRLPLRSWYWYRQQLRGIAPPDWPRSAAATAIRIRSDRDAMRTDGTDDAWVVVELIDEKGRIVDDARTVALEVIEGGGLFPTGKSYTLSPQERSLLDGTGAIEFRSYYAGVNRIRAMSEGLEATTIEIRGDGDTPWDDRPRILASGPPSREGLPGQTTPHQLAAKRPVFSSSSAVGRPAQLVTDHAETEGWKSATQEPGAWISVDLEGTWTLDRLEITFGDDAHVPYVLEYAAPDGLFHVAAEGTTRYRTASAPLNGAHARIIRIRFPEAPAEVIEVSVHGC
jgi:beta-galactosidase